MLQSWNDGPARQAVLEFLRTVPEDGPDGLDVVRKLRGITVTSPSADLVRFVSRVPGSVSGGRASAR